MHLKSYKYSSVDKSLISHYILRHYVRFKHLTRLTDDTLADFLEIVEWLCQIVANVACSEYGHLDRLPLHISERHMSGDMDTRSCWAGMIQMARRLVTECKSSA